MWVDRVPSRVSQVVYEDRAVRLAFRPVPRPGGPSRPEDLVSPDFERAAVGCARGLTTTSWG
jgi:hypothetical protein